MRVSLHELILSDYVLTTDYDEGAADALMSLAGDRQTTQPELPPLSNKRPGSPNSPAKNKKARPEVDRVAGAAAGPAASNGSSPKPSPAKSRMVIEVLNSPSIGAPIAPGSATPKHRDPLPGTPALGERQPEKPTEQPEPEPIAVEQAEPVAEQKVEQSTEKQEMEVDEVAKDALAPPAPEAPAVQEPPASEAPRDEPAATQTKAGNTLSNAIAADNAASAQASDKDVEMQDAKQATEATTEGSGEKVDNGGEVEAEKGETRNEDAVTTAAVA